MRCVDPSEAEPPPPPSLSLPGLPNFRVPSAGVVSTVFPAATGGTPPYAYRLTGLPPGLAFSSSTRRASGTLPTVATDTTAQPPSRVRRTLETRVGLVFATETDSPGRTYSFTLASRQTVNVSLTGMDRDIDCSVNGSSCSNRGGTSDNDWSRELAAGSHSVRVYPYRGGTGDYTIMAVVNCPAGHFASGGSCYRYVVPSPSSVTAASGTEAQACDDNTELEEGKSCVEGIVVDEVVNVTSTHILIRRLPGGGGGTPTPSWVTPLKQEQLDTAVDDAIVKSRTCSVTPVAGGPSYNANAELTTARDGGRIILGGLNCSGNVAYVPVLNPTQIRICEPFFEQSALDRSLTIMHEGLHLDGLVHTDFLDATGPGDHGPMEDAIRSSCGYPP